MIRPTMLTDAQRGNFEARLATLDERDTEVLREALARLHAGHALSAQDVAGLPDTLHYLVGTS